MSRWVIAAFALAALVVVPSAISQIVVGKTVVRTAELRPGATRSLVVSCPRGYFAVSAGVYSPVDGANTLSIQSRSLRAFTFRLGNPPANPGGRVAVAAACRRIRAAGGTVPYLQLKPLKARTVRVEPSGRRQVQLVCPPRTVPAAAGFDLGRAGATLALPSQTQTLRAFTFEVVNRGTAARTVSFHGSCLTVVGPAGARGGQLQVRLATSTIPMHPGSQVVTKRCPRGWLSLATGYSLPPGLTLNGATAALRQGRWSVTSRPGSQELATFELVCSRLTG
jgi:hypothetical protein